VNTVQEINSELEKIATAQVEFLTRNGETPNFLTAPLDVNSQRLINLPQPRGLSDPVRLLDLNNAVGASNPAPSSTSSIEFETVADILSGNSIGGEVSLLIGNIVTALDYKEGCNSGKLIFKVVDAGTGTADGGTYIDFPTQSLQLKQFMSVAPVKASAFGAMRNGVHDDKTALQAAINFYATLSSGQVQSKYNGNSAYLKMINGNVFSFCGVCNVTNTITVPPMSHFILGNGGIAADKNNWAGASTDFLLNFNSTSTPAGFAYNNGALENVSIISNKVCNSLKIGAYNRFHLNNVHVKGFNLIGLQTGNSPTDDSHEMITDGLYVGEYDFYDEARLTTAKTGTGIYNLAHDGIWRNFVVYSSYVGVVNRGQGNDWGDFHIWDMPKHTTGDYEGQIPGFVNLDATDTMVHDFKLGSCSMIIQNPFLCVVDTWQFERTQSAVDIDVIVLKPDASGIFLQRAVIKNGLIHVANPSLNSGKTNFIAFDIDAGTSFDVSQTKDLYVGSIVSNGNGTLYQTEYSDSISTGSVGVTFVTYDWSNYMLIPSLTRLRSWNCNSNVNLFIKPIMNIANKTISFQNYTDATYSTTTNFELNKTIDFTLGCKNA
tara:strand:- start:89 stop:1897 length:1809 start_codon:yes stop_codon:yes gene_type:complete